MILPNLLEISDSRVVHLATVVMVSDWGDDELAAAQITTIDGEEIEITGDDADALFERLKVMDFLEIAAGLFINFAVVSIFKDRSESGRSIAGLTTTAGAEIDINGSDADALFKCLELITGEINAAMPAAVAQLEEAAAAAEVHVK